MFSIKAEQRTPEPPKCLSKHKFNRLFRSCLNLKPHVYFYHICFYTLLTFDNWYWHLITEFSFIFNVFFHYIVKNHTETITIFKTSQYYQKVVYYHNLLSRNCSITWRNSYISFKFNLSFLIYIFLLYYIILSYILSIWLTFHTNEIKNAKMHKHFTKLSTSN